MNKKNLNVVEMSSLAESELMWRVQQAIDLAIEEGYSAKGLDEWLDGKQAFDLPDFAWYCVYVVQKVMEHLEGKED